MRKLLKGKFPALLLLVTSLSVQAQSAAAQADTGEAVGTTVGAGGICFSAPS